METPILGKVAFITGAGYGVGCDPKKQGEHAPNMGAAIAQRLAKMGAVVVATDINADAAAVTVTSLETYPGNPAHSSFKLDVTNKAEIEAVLAEVQKKYGRLDIVCCNAGVSSMAPFEKLSEKEWDFNVDVNMKGVFLCMQAVIPYLKRGGRIVNTCSMAAIKPDPTLAHYTASKFGVLGLTKAAAIGLAGYGITVNCVCPGWVKTPMQDREIVWEGAMKGITPEEVRQSYIDHTPLGRLCYPEDVANAVAFFVLPESDFITGEAMNVSGGANL